MSGMARSWWRWCGQVVAFGSGLVVGGTLAKLPAIAQGAPAKLMMGFTAGNSVFAQIVPDRTLPNNSRVTTQDNIRVISGGTIAGSNLFHSFSEFSVPTGGTAFFNNATQIQNILTRVTGNSVSNIDGLIRVNGTANLFLLNPNGIIFGSNASLNVGGSFLATTADAIGFGNLGFFSATTPNTPSPLLTVNPSALLFNQIASAPITSQSIAPAGLDPIREPTYGLRVPDGRSLLLLGGDISVNGLGIGDSVNEVNGGGLKAYGGRIELGGLAGAGTVGLVVDGNNLSLSFPIGVVRSSVSLTNAAELNVQARGGGSIAVNAQNFSMAGVSVLLAGIDSGLGSTGSIAGNIEINATGEINLTDGSNIFNDVLEEAGGQGGDINITSRQLYISDGSQVGAGTYGSGNGGRLTVNVTDKVQVIGESADGEFASGLYSQTEGTGNAGNLTITTGQLLVSDGAVVSTTTFGAGNAGSLIVNATDKVQVIGESADAFSGLFANSDEGGTGNAGDVTVNTPSLLVGDGALVFAGNRGSGNSGNVTVNVSSLLVWGGAQIGTLNNGPGKGGTLIVNAADKVQVIGTSRDGQDSSGLFTSTTDTGNAGDLTITTGQLLVSDGAQVNADTDATGNGGSLIVKASEGVQLSGADSGLFVDATVGGTAGDLTVETRQMSVRDGAQVTVSSSLGQAGNLTIQANSLLLNGGKLLAETAKSDPQESGANINLLGLDLLRLDNESQISANANNQAKGGNIRIESTFVVATPPTSPRGSDITANAEKGNGGAVNITTQGLFGIAFRQERTPKNDITVTSESGIPGTFQLDNLGIDPSQGLVALPTTLVDASQLIDRSCSAGGRLANRENSFTITGRGGLPPNPRQVLRSQAVEVDWVTLEAPANNPTESVQNRGTQRRVSGEQNSRIYNTVNTRSHEIVEAQGWVVDANGKITLVATAPTVTPHSSWLPPADCRTVESTKRSNLLLERPH